MVKTEQGLQRVTLPLWQSQTNYSSCSSSLKNKVGANGSHHCPQQLGYSITNKGQDVKHIAQKIWTMCYPVKYQLSQLSDWLPAQAKSIVFKVLPSQAANKNL